MVLVLWDKKLKYIKNEYFVNDGETNTSWAHQFFNYLYIISIELELFIILIILRIPIRYLINIDDENLEFSIYGFKEIF